MEKDNEKKVVKALGSITLGSMVLGACGWELVKFTVHAVKMAITGKMD